MSRAVDRVGLQTLVVDLAVGRPADAVHHDDPLGRLVGGEGGLDMGDHGVDVDRLAGTGFDDTGDDLAEPLVRDADGDRVDHGRDGVFIASSTSSGKTFSPPVLMHTEPRPSSVIPPSASTVAKSPGQE